MKIYMQTKKGSKPFTYKDLVKNLKHQPRVDRMTLAASYWSDIKQSVASGDNYELPSHVMKFNRSCRLFGHKTI